jgi:putative ATP-dependent endonuclease of OLD family
VPGNQGVTSITADSFAPVYIERLSIRAFRGISECQIEFEPGVTVLAGHNNAGKSRILSALHLALGGRGADVDDFTVGLTQDPEIDLVLAPRPPEQGNAEDAFDDVVGRRLGTGVQTIQEDPLRERFAWRTHIRRSAEGGSPRTETRELTFDVSAREWAERRDAPGLRSEQRKVFAVDLVDTRRDLMEELARRGSPIRKILSDLEVEAENRQALEGQLAGLGRSIVSGSATLTSVRVALEELHQLIGSMGVPHLNPLPLTLEELARSVSVDLNTGTGALPIRMHGSGSRSLASLQVQGVLYDRRLGRDGSSLLPHPVTLVEEPEAHLHPQATFELSHLLNALRGQKVVSTHSAQLVSTVEPRAIRLLRGRPPTISVIDLGPASSAADATHRAFRPDLHTAEMEKLRRQVERPFGELIFAKAVVIGDGATERAFLPVVIRHALGHSAHGVCAIDPGSMNSPLAKAAVKFAHITKTPWVLFADGDDAGTSAAEELMAEGDGDRTRLVWIGTTDAAGVTSLCAFEAMMSTFDDEICWAACEDVRPGTDRSKPLLKAMKTVKGSVGVALARRLTEKYPDSAAWPGPLQALLMRLRQEL